jgi:hypothetical protein
MQKQQVKSWQHDWRRKVGERPTEQNQALFHKYVEYAHQVLEENQEAAFPYSDVRQVCQPQYLFQVVSEMRSDKLVVIHTVR